MMMKMISIILHRFIVLCLIILCNVLFTLPVSAETLQWDFNRNAKDWEVTSGVWQVKNGVYQISKGGVEHAVVGEKDWGDYAIEAKVRIDKGSWAGIVFRAIDEEQYYAFLLNTQLHIMQLYRYKTRPPNAVDLGWGFKERLEEQIRPVGNIEIANGKWFDMKVEVEGDTFKLYLNNRFQKEHSNHRYKTGKVGVWAVKTAASFDDFTVSGENITLAVDPNRKLATTWGRIKINR
ncbi:MAG: DUF1080 domain-containing protein [Candidatus Poribacteria bacterium]|nr:DUF1080 domain-containing protein [Candidatus Poribacteria bacterium]MDE0317821.1 DUF1080 domain-containing protein [Candidatus Poribacteria bacterium]